jgi:hypothetical protein
MSRVHAALLMSGLMVAACTPALYRQDRRVQVQGDVARLADSAPLGDAQVLLYWFRGEEPVAVPAATVSDERGQFQLDVAIPVQLPCEELLLMIRRIGYRMARTSVGTLECRGGCRRVSVVLEPAAATEPAPERGRGIAIGLCR